MLEIETLVDPSANTQLMGLYRSSGTYCTSMRGRRLSPDHLFPRSPDVMAVYTTGIEAKRAEARYLLANGNLIEAGDVSGTDRHFASLARSVSEAILPVRHGRRRPRLCRGQVRHHVRAAL